MKYLKIEKNKGYYTIDEKKWIQIDEITKDHILLLLDLAIDKDFEMDLYDSNKLANQAHQIIYKNIYEKLTDLCKNRNRFKDESKSMYREALEKYRNIPT